MEGDRHILGRMASSGSFDGAIVDDNMPWRSKDSASSSTGTTAQSTVATRKDRDRGEPTFVRDGEDPVILSLKLTKRGALIWSERKVELRQDRLTYYSGRYNSTPCDVPLDVIESVAVKTDDTVPEMRVRRRDGQGDLRFRAKTVRVLKSMCDGITKQVEIWKEARERGDEVMSYVKAYVDELVSEQVSYVRLRDHLRARYGDLVFQMHKTQIQCMCKTLMSKKTHRRTKSPSRLSSTVKAAASRALKRRTSSSPKGRQRAHPNSPPKTRLVASLSTPNVLRSAGYRLCEIIGKGSFASVYRSEHVETGRVVAVKSCDKTKQNAKRRCMEIKTLKLVCHHRNFVHVEHICENQQSLYIVTELMGGGELFNHIIQCGRFSESDCRIVAKQLLDATAFMHSMGILHRDLKPENLLLASKGNINDIRIVDFGQATIIRRRGGDAKEPGDVDRDTHANTLGGTLSYLAPEVLLSDHSHAFPVDIWSIGVILFVLLGGQHPFPDSSPMRYIKAIESLALERSDENRLTHLFAVDIFCDISIDAKELILDLIRPSPVDRLTAKEALSSTWLTSPSPPPTITSTHDNDGVDDIDVTKAMGVLDLKSCEDDSNDTPRPSVTAAKQSIKTPIFEGPRRRPRAPDHAPPISIGRRSTWASPDRVEHDGIAASGGSENLSSRCRRVSADDSNRRRSARLKIYRESMQRHRKRARRGFLF